MSRYILSSDAEADVEEIIDYYLFEKKSVYAAETVNREFYAVFRTLAGSPGQGHHASTGSAGQQCFPVFPHHGWFNHRRAMG